MCEYFVREETSKIERAIYWRENFRKSEHFCEHQKFGEDFWGEHFNILVFRKRVKRLFSRLKKARKKKPMLLMIILLDKKWTNVAISKKTFS